MMESNPGESVAPQWRGKRSVARQLVAWLLGLAAGSAATGCRPSNASPDGQPSISAKPNPVPPGDGAGTTTIHWDTGNGTGGEVYVAVDGGEEKLVADQPDGAVTADWIQPGSRYEFRLYAAPGRARLLGSVKVAMGKTDPR